MKNEDEIIQEMAQESLENLALYFGEKTLIGNREISLMVSASVVLLGTFISRLYLQNALPSDLDSYMDETCKSLREFVFLDIQENK